LPQGLGGDHKTRTQVAESVGMKPRTYAPTQEVLHAQAVSFITRALVAKGFWRAQPDDPALYANVPAGSGHRRDLATYVHYAGALPDAPAGAPFAAWDRPSTRAWFARALWQALQSYYGPDRVP